MFHIIYTFRAKKIVVHSKVVDIINIFLVSTVLDQFLDYLQLICNMYLNLYLAPILKTINIFLVS